MTLVAQDSVGMQTLLDTIHEFEAWSGKGEVCSERVCSFRKEESCLEESSLHRETLSCRASNTTISHTATRATSTACASHNDFRVILILENYP